MTDTPVQPVEPPRRTVAFVQGLLPARRRLPASWRKPVAWLLPAGVLLGAVGGGVYGVMQKAEYTATGYVIAVPAQKSSDPAAPLGFAQAYGRVATQLAVLSQAQVWANVPVATLRDSVRTATSPDAPMVAISATSSHPAMARDMADAVSAALSKHANDSAPSTGVKVLRFSPALLPTEPSSASPALTTLVGASAGGLLGGLALLARPRRPAAVGDPAVCDDAARASVPAPSKATAVHEKV